MLTGLVAACGGAEPTKPNILVFLADDLGWNDVGWRNPQVRTPNLDRLRAEGIELTQHYVGSMCTPSRAAFLTGRFPTRFGISVAQNERALPFDTVTLAGALQDVGYDTAIIGKWHLGSVPESGPQRFGFAHSYGVLAGGCGPYSHLYKAGPYAKTWHREGKLIDEEGHVTDLIAHDAVRWLERRGDRPFFLYVPFTAPHVPIAEPKEWLERNAHVAQPSKREYYAAVSHMDAVVGQIMAALERLGKRGNTLVLFFSDNGATPDQPNESWLTSDDPRDRYTPGPAGGSNHPLRGKKTTVYEGGIRVPAFVYWPGKLARGAFHGVVHAADWMPTFAQIADYRPPGDLKWDGRDVWPAITGAQRAESRRLYWASARFADSAVRDGDWKLIITHADDRAQLFNLARDPNETTDLATKEPAHVARLRGVLRELAVRDNDAKVNAAISAPSRPTASSRAR